MMRVLCHLVFEKDEGVVQPFHRSIRSTNPYSICAAAKANPSAASHAVPPVGSLSQGEPMRGALTVTSLMRHGPNQWDASNLSCVETLARVRILVPDSRTASLGAPITLIQFEPFRVPLICVFHVCYCYSLVEKSHVANSEMS